MKMEEFSNAEVSPENMEIGVEKHKQLMIMVTLYNIKYEWLKLYLVVSMLTNVKK